MSKELKPCPFCGGEAVLQAIDFEPDYDDLPIWWVRCSSCLAETAEFTGATEADAVKAWNTRAACYDCQMGGIPATEENMAKYGWVKERTCRNDDGWCSECEHFLHDGFNWCPWCGAKVVKK